MSTMFNSKPMMACGHAANDRRALADTADVLVNVTLAGILIRLRLVIGLTDNAASNHI